MLDIELLKLPSIGPDDSSNREQTTVSNLGTCKTGKNYVPHKQILQGTGVTVKKAKKNNANSKEL